MLFKLKFANFIKMLFCKRCLIFLGIVSVVHISAQDISAMYGAQYESRQRVRPPAIQNNPHNLPVAEGQSQPMINPCRGTWQWACENLECIAQYDICDGIDQCSDGSDEKNCEHRQAIERVQHVPGRQIDIELKDKGTTHAPQTTTANHTKAATTQKTFSNSISSISVPVEYLLVGLTLGIFVAGLLHCLIRKKKRPSRNFRKGDAIDEDEDDVLISQMYS